MQTTASSSSAKGKGKQRAIATSTSTATAAAASVSTDMIAVGPIQTINLGEPGVEPGPGLDMFHASAPVHAMADDSHDMDPDSDGEFVADIKPEPASDQQSRPGPPHLHIVTTPAPLPPAGSAAAKKKRVRMFNDAERMAHRKFEKARRESYKQNLSQLASMIPETASTEAKRLSKHIVTTESTRFHRLANARCREALKGLRELLAERDDLLKELNAHRAAVNEPPRTARISMADFPKLGGFPADMERIRSAAMAHRRPLNADNEPRETADELGDDAATTDSKRRTDADKKTDKMPAKDAPRSALPPPPPPPPLPPLHHQTFASVSEPAFKVELNAMAFKDDEVPLPASAPLSLVPSFPTSASAGGIEPFHFPTDPGPAQFVMPDSMSFSDISTFSSSFMPSHEEFMYSSQMMPQMAVPQVAHYVRDEQVYPDMHSEAGPGAVYHPGHPPL